MSTIADRLADRWPNLRRMLASPTHIVEVPFRVCPYDDSDGQPGILWTDSTCPDYFTPRAPVPANMLPEGSPPSEGHRSLSARWANPPFPSIALLGNDQRDPGLILVFGRRLKPGEGAQLLTEWFHGAHVPEQARLMGDSRWYIQAVSICAIPGMAVPQTLCVPMLLGDWVTVPPYLNPKNLSDEVIANNQPADIVRYAAYLLVESLTLGAAIADQPLDQARIKVTAERAFAADLVLATRTVSDRVNDAAWIQRLTVTALALMNARNVTVDVRPGAPLDRAARRRHDLPRLTYHVLVVRPLIARRDDAPGETGQPLPIHWVRGHFKEYKTPRLLFGKYAGLYWWQPHLAGRDRDRRVDKSYRLQVPTA